MFCSKCGCQNADGSAFCRNCGNQLTANQTANSSYQQPETAYFSNPQGTPYAGFMNSLASVVKKVCASPIALVAIIAYTASILLNLFVTIRGSGGIFAYIYRLADMLGMQDMMWESYEVIRGCSNTSAVIGMITTILIAVGLWIAYASAVNRDAPMKTGGLTLIKVILSINLVFICIVLAIIEFSALIAIAGVSNSNYYDDSYVVATLVGIMIGFAIVFTLIILFYAKAIKTINAMKFTIRTGNQLGRPSVYVAVMSFIFGISSLISIYSSYGIFPALVNLCSATAYIAFGVFIFYYRSKMPIPVQGVYYQGVPVAGYQMPPQPTNYTVPNYPQNNGVNNQPTTVLPENNTPQLITCPNCNGQYNAQESSCPYCGYEERT